MANRVHKSIMNAKVGLCFYFISIFLAFFSRNIFLNTLGIHFMGLTSTLGGILGLLNISELGIGTCIGYFLYKPIEQGDQDKICDIVSVFGWFYKIVGSFILCTGFILSIFFPLIFAKEEISIGIIYFTFYSFLFSNVIGYFINYRQILLDSDQKTYKISIWTQTGVSAKTLLQIYLAYNYKNPYIWVSLEFIFGLFVCWILNYIIKREYPWLKTNIRNGRKILKTYPEILTKTKQVFIHRIKNSFISKCDEIFIFSFESLQMVTFYGNYNMIIGKLTALFNNVFTGMNASIGNLVAEGDKKNIQKVFWEFIFFRYWITGVLIINLTFIINPVITWWLGEQYVLQRHIVFLILFNMYIMFTTPTTSLFINAYGLYDDTWAAYAEAFLNITVTLVCGYYYGLTGILLGKTISTTLIGAIWKPFYLYKRGFQESIHTYWYNIFIHIIILILCIYLNHIIISVIGWKIMPSITGLLLYSICISLPLIILYTIFVAVFTSGAKDLISRLYIINNNNTNKNN